MTVWAGGCRRPHASAPEAVRAVQHALASPRRQRSGVLSLARSRSLSGNLGSSKSPTHNGLHGSKSPPHNSGIHHQNGGAVQTRPAQEKSTLRLTLNRHQ